MAAPRKLGMNGRASMIMIIIMSVAIAAGCGGAGPSGTSSGNSAVVSLSQAPQFPAGTAAAAALSTADAQAAGGATPYATDVAHVWITVEKVALIPGDSPGPDLCGEEPVEGAAGGVAGHVSGAVVPAKTIDLLNLPSGDVAAFLNRIENIPAGTYGKIRLYYRDPKVHFFGAPDNTPMHPTANSHLDIHFVDGGMVIPVRTNPGGGVAVHNVVITFVIGKDGLKITVNKDKVLMRPQVFATVETVRMAVSGWVDNLDKVAGSFDIETGPADGRSFHAVYDVTSSDPAERTRWSFNTADRFVSVGESLGVAALRDTAFVDVFGMFDSALVLHADEIRITFPASEAGVVATGFAGNSFKLAVGADNIVVTAMPDRLEAHFDNNVSFDNVTYAAVVPGVEARARGYAVGGEIEAYWISVGSVGP